MSYSKQDTDIVVELYKSGISVQAIAEKMERPERSIIAKLAAEGCYQAKPRKKERVKKEVYISMIAKALNVSEDRLDSLEKANILVLRTLVEKLNDSQ
jgi:hypothetical protein